MADDKKRYGDEDFWSQLGSMSKKSTADTRQMPQRRVAGLPYRRPSTTAVDISDTSAPIQMPPSGSGYKDEDTRLPTGASPYSAAVGLRKGGSHSVYEYTPDSILLRRVRIFSERRDSVDQADNSLSEQGITGESTRLFSRDGIFFRERRSLLSREGKECPYAPYYSVSPRYTQLTRKQLSFYLWWRECARRGELILTDESYVLLYVSELVATEEPESIPECLLMLCEIYKKYKDTKGTVRLFLPDIICDFCLIHKLPCPIEHLSDSYREIYQSARLREFFLGLSGTNRTLFSDILVDLLPVYDYRRSKFAQSTHRELFDTHIYGAMRAILSDDKAFAALSSFSHDTFNMTTVERKPYATLGLFRSEGIKLEVCYFAIDSLREVVTNAVRHAENRLRAYLGVKTMLQITNLDRAISSVIDEYMARCLPSSPMPKKRPTAKPKKEEAAPEYERLYESVNVEISFEEATRIEQASWRTTEKLVEAFENMAENNDPPSTTAAPGGSFRHGASAVPPHQSAPLTASPAGGSLSELGTNGKKSFPPEEEGAERSEANERTILENLSSTPSSVSCADSFPHKEKPLLLFRSALGDKFGFIPLCLAHDASSQRDFARQFGLSPDGLADEINEASLDIIGDILLEDTDGTYTVIEDYIEYFE